MALKIILLVAFSAVTIFIGVYFRKRSQNVDNYLLGGRKVGPWLSAFSYGATYFSAVVFVGYAGQFGWRFGVAAVLIGLGNAFIGSLLAWKVLGRRTRLMTQHIKSATMPDFFGIRYNSKNLKIAASLIVFIFLLPYTASLYNGLSRIFAVGLNIDFIWCIIGMSILTLIYVVLGGYFATAVNDFIQGLIMIAGIVVIIAVVLNNQGGLYAALDGIARVPADQISGPGAGAPGVLTSLFGPDPWNLLGVLILTSLGTWGLPQMVHRFYAIKSEKMIFKGTVISTVFAIIIAGGCYFLGAFGRLYPADGGGHGGYDTIIPRMITSFPDVLIGFVIILVLAASISTLSSLVMSSSSTLTRDFIKVTFAKKMSDKKELIVMRSLVAVFIIISAAIAIFQYEYAKTHGAGIAFIAQLMGISWGALAGAFLAPFLYGLFWKRATKASVWACFGFSTVFMTISLFLSLFLSNEVKQANPFLLSPINWGAASMLMGLIIVPAVSMFTKAPKKEIVEDCFSAYKPVAVAEAEVDAALGSAVVKPAVAVKADAALGAAAQPAIKADSVSGSSDKTAVKPKASNNKKKNT